jgi:hypothetical protein
MEEGHRDREYSQRVIIRARQDQRAAVGPRFRYGFGGEIAAGARPVVDDDRLTQPLLQRLRDQPRGKIDHAPCREPHHDMDSPGRKTLQRSPDAQ